MAYGKATNTTSGDNYLHTFGYKTAKDLESFSVQRIKNATTDIIDTYKGCKVNVFTVSWNAGGGGTGKFVECSLDCLAKEVVETETEKTEEASPSAYALLQSRQVIVTLNGTDYTHCLSGSIVMNNNLSDGWYADATLTNTRGETEPQLRKWTGSFTIQYEDDDVFDLWKAGTSVSGACTVKFQRSATDYALFTFTGFRLNSAPDETKLDGFNTMSINWTADSCIPTVLDGRDDYYETA